ATSFPHAQIQVDTGYRVDPKPHFEFSTVVTRIASDGFYATDVADDRGFTGVFAFNFNAPPGMRVCDRLLSFGGTSSDFFGFTEIGFPTWELEEWNPKDRKCMVPSPYAFRPGDLPIPAATTPQLLSKVSGLVRLITADKTT